MIGRLRTSQIVTLPVALLSLWVSAYASGAQGFYTTRDGLRHQTVGTCRNLLASRTEFLRLTEDKGEKRSALEPTTGSNVQVFHHDQAHVVESENIWTPEQRSIIRKIVRAESKEEGKNTLQILNKFPASFSSDLSQPLLDRIKSVVHKIAFPDSPAELLKMKSITIHLEGARTFQQMHRHGGGGIVLAFSEEGPITEIEGIDLILNNGHMSAIFTDGVLHRPRQNGPRFIVFVGLSLNSDLLRDYAYGLSNRSLETIPLE